MHKSLWVMSYLVGFFIFCTKLPYYIAQKAGQVTKPITYKLRIVAICITKVKRLVEEKDIWHM